MKRSLGLLVMVVAVAWSMPAQGGQVLHMYTALDTAESQLYIPEFEKDTGIKVQWVRLSSGEVLARLRAEAKNPQVSIWYGGPSQDHVSGKKAGISTPYKPPLDWTLLDNAHDAEWHWVGYYFGAIGFASNTEFLKRAGVPAPASWADLLKPAYKGQIAIAFPYTSGTSYTVLATLVQMMGEDKAFEYWRKLNQNVHHYDKSGSAPVTQAGLGEVGIAVSFSHDILTKGSDKGYPIAMTFPSEGTGYEIGGISLVKGGQEPDLAKKFVDWALSVRAQNLMKQWFRIPLNPKAEVAKGAVRADQVKLINFDAVKAGDERDRLIKRWRSEIGQ
ncbi:MAG TPA: ABC transporter substrate-binding protein [Candidatus Methylomirabilis sp.]|nr:ABC transporter substrate-binding protein [Candidatus Methylomirabilis sp.]HSC71839.1 ABC transporter substrate-binding protein [Candidatus Methylomirabilis sp.]